MVATTSGSTGRPRWVVRSERSWADSLPAFTALTGLGPTDTVALTGPVSTTLHLFAAVHTLCLGAHLTDRPEAATAVHAVPTVLRSLLDLPTDAPLRRVVTAGAGLPADLTHRIHTRGWDLVEYYGAAELSFVAAGRPPGPLRAFPGAEIDIRDGEIWVRSPYLADGYLGLDRAGLGPGFEPGAGATGALRRDATGFATVGDHGVLVDGGLTVAGRGDTAITTGGATVLAEDIEAAVLAHPAVAEAVAVGTPSPRWGELVTVVVRLHPDADPTGLRAAARAALSPAARPRRWLVAAELPRTPGGKIARGAVRDALRDGTPDWARPLP
nr:AMP-binding protein [Nakamurella flavida]